MSIVKIRITSDGNKYNIRVGVASTKKPNLWANRDLDPGKASDERQLKQLIAASAMLCAEYLGEKHGDTHDLGIVARTAVTEFGKECALVSLLQSGLPVKLSRLASCPMTADKVELVDRLKFKLERGSVLTVDEVDWIDKTLANETRK